MAQFSGGPEAVSQFPDPTSRSLDAWLADKSAATDAQTISTRLHGLAFARAADIAVGATALAVGITTFPIGAFWSAVAASFAPVIIASIVGALLIVLGMLLIRRARSKLPDERRARIIRGAGRARGGWILAGGIWLVLAAIVLSALPSLSDREDGIVIGLIGIVVCMALLLVSVFVVPATVLGRARESLRRVASTDAKYRALLEQDRLTWRPQFGDQMYGPL